MKFSTNQFSPESSEGTHIYYMVWCDNANAPPEIEADKMFELSEYTKMEKYLDICLKHSLKYEAMIEIWNEKEDIIAQRIYLTYKETK